MRFWGSVAGVSSPATHGGLTQEQPASLCGQGWHSVCSAESLGPTSDSATPSRGHFSWAGFLRGNTVRACLNQGAAELGEPWSGEQGSQGTQKLVPTCPQGPPPSTGTSNVLPFWSYQCGSRDTEPTCHTTKDVGAKRQGKGGERVRENKTRRPSNLVCTPQLSSSAHREDIQVATKDSIMDRKRNAS